MQKNCKLKAYQGGGGHGYPRTPPSYAPVEKLNLLVQPSNHSRISGRRFSSYEK